MHNAEDETENANLRTEEPSIAGDFCTCFDGNTGEGVSKCDQGRLPSRNGGTRGPRPKVMMQFGCHTHSTIFLEAS